MKSQLKQLRESLQKTRIPKISKKSSVKRKEQNQQLRRNVSKVVAPPNPFDLKFTRQKHVILGRTQKGVVGRPLEQHKKSQKIREETIGLELKTKNRKSTIIDKRFGENDATLTQEDKMLQRMMKEKTKKAAYNLEETPLTHMGQSLDFDKFDHPPEEDQSDLGEEVVDQLHFGGFEPQKKSRQEIMNGVIGKAKTEKRLRQAQKEHDLDMVDEVDQDIDEIRALLAPMSNVESKGKMVVSNDRLALIRGEIQRPSEKQIGDEQDYDRFVRELVYDRRAQPSNRTKSEEEIAAELKTELEELETARVHRMNGTKPDEKPKKKEKIKATKDEADDLGDSHYTQVIDDKILAEVEMPLTYKDGVLVNDTICMAKPEDGSDSSLGSEQDSESAESEDEDSGSETEPVNQNVSVEDFEDLPEGMESDFEDVSEVDSGPNDAIEAVAAAASELSDVEEELGSEEELEEMEKNIESNLQEVKELPFTFEAPSTYDELLLLFENRLLEEHITIIERLIILNNPKLGPDARSKLETLMALLVEHLENLGLEPILEVEHLKLMEALVVKLCRQFPNAFAALAKQQIVNMREKLNKAILSGRRNLPMFGQLQFFKVLGMVYSTSDLEHPVITPAMLLMGQYLCHCTVTTATDVASGLLLCQLLHEYTRLSKRYIPETVNFLNALLVSALQGIKGLDIPCRMPDLGRFRVDIAITDFMATHCTLNVGELFSLQPVVSQKLLMAFFMQAVNLLSQISGLLKNSTSVIEIFEPALKLLAQAPIANDEFTRYLGKMQDVSAQASAARTPLLLQTRKAVAIKAFLPKFETNYSVDKRYDPDRARQAAQKDRNEYKQQHKGAIKELRKDTQFVARVRLEETKKKDAAYKQKIGRIMGDLGSQEGVMRGFDREKKRPKRK